MSFAHCVEPQHTGPSICVPLSLLQDANYYLQHLVCLVVHQVQARPCGGCGTAAQSIQEQQPGLHLVRQLQG